MAPETFPFMLAREQVLSMYAKGARYLRSLPGLRTIHAKILSLSFGQMRSIYFADGLRLNVVCGRDLPREAESRDMVLDVSDSDTGLMRDKVREVSNTLRSEHPDNT